MIPTSPPPSYTLHSPPAAQPHPLPPPPPARFPALRVLTLGNLIETDLPEREHLVSPWLRNAESALVYAPTGVGKSMFALSLALAMAGGGEYLGWECPTPRNVLYVDGEMHISDIKDRAQGLLDRVSIIDRDRAWNNLRFAARQYQEPDFMFPSIATEDGKQMILDLADDCDLVILDNLSTLASLRDENKASEFVPVMGLLMSLKQADKACILVHHSGKKGTSYRGSSMLATTFEVIIGLKPRDDAKARSGTSFTIEWEKYRGEPDSRCSPMDVWLDREGWHFESSAEDEVGLMLTELRQGDYGNQGELAKALGWSPAKLSRTKRRAIQTGQIDEAAWSGCFRLIDKGEAMPSTPSNDAPPDQSDDEESPSVLTDTPGDHQRATIHEGGDAAEAA